MSAIPGDNRNSNNDQPNPTLNSIPKPEKHLTVQIARNNLIGQCLNEALHEIQMMDTKSNTRKRKHQQKEEGDEDEGDEEEEEKSTTSHDPRKYDEQTESHDDTKEQQPLMTAEMSEHILQAFGEAVSNTPWHQQPPALARGKMKRFTHFNTNWQIVMEDMKVRPRPILGQEYPKRKRHCDRLPLWNITPTTVATTMTTNDHQKTAVDTKNRMTDNNIENDDHDHDIVSIDGPTQLLAYDDT